MIRIDDDWVIDVDEHNYIVKKDLHRYRDSKTKDGRIITEHQYATKAYYGTLEGALDRVREEMVRNELISKEHDLESAVNVIRKCYDHWFELTRKILEVSA